MKPLTKYTLFTLTSLLALGGLKAQSFERLKSFENISELQDVNGVAVADYDQDGDLDVYLVCVHQYNGDRQTWSRLLQNNGPSGFKDVTLDASLTLHNPGIRDGWMGDRMGASWGDYDNDGFPDLFLSNNGFDELWHNEGNGSFKNVSGEAGVIGCFDCYSSNGLWWDYDLDGDLDLYVSDWLKVNRQYRNDGAGTFTDVSLETGLNDSSKSWASIPIDINQDLFPDLYVVNDFGENKLFLNNGEGLFREATRQFGLEDDGDGMGVDICDYNNDGNFDIYVTNIFAQEPNPFFVNNGEGAYDDLARNVGIDDTGWGWGARFFDADHDMDEDLYVVNGMFLSAGKDDRNAFFRNVDGNFHNISNSLGLDLIEQARGLEVFDFDRDGDVDILVANRGANMGFFQNTLIENAEPNSNWIEIELEGVISNKDALGSIVSISCKGNKQFRHFSGANLMGQSIKALHFGLEDHTEVEEVEIIWPNGQKEYFNQLAANQFHKLTEGTGRNESSLMGQNPLVVNPSSLIFPNPFMEEIQISLEDNFMGWVEFSLFDIRGKEIYKEKNWIEQQPLHRIHFPKSLLQAGFYIYRLKVDQHRKPGKNLQSELTLMDSYFHSFLTKIRTKPMRKYFCPFRKNINKPLYAYSLSGWSILHKKALKPLQWFLSLGGTNISRVSA